MKITITHPDDAALSATFRPPVDIESAWREYWRGIATANPDTMTATYNLALAFVETPDPRGFVELCDKWPGLPEVASPHLQEIAGQLTFLTRRSTTQVQRAGGAAFSDEALASLESGMNSRVIDLRAVAQAIDVIEAGGAAIDQHDAITTLQDAGITAAMIKGWLARYHETLCVQTPHGVFVFRKSSRAALVALSNQVSRGNAYDGARSFVAACALHPEPGLLPIIFVKAPAACTSLMLELRLMADETVAAIVKKE
jgi:hypothetical protein